MLNSIFSFIVALGILVFLHEYGHYSVARLCKVTVVRFSVGFGRAIYQWTNPKTGVVWSIGWIPLGGYVRMLDERDPESISSTSDLSGAFNRQHVSKRIAIVLAGPVANLLVAWLLYAVLSLSQSQQLAPVAQQPLPETVAHNIGLKSQDRIVSINGTQIRDWQGVSWGLLSAKLFDDGLAVEVIRNGARLELPTLTEDQLDAEFSRNLPEELGFSPFESQVIIGGVRPSSAAERAGLQSQDVLISLDGQLISSARQFTNMIQNIPEQTANLTVQRGNDLLQLPIVPERLILEDGSIVGRLGVGVGGKKLIEDVNYSLLEAIQMGGNRMIEVSALSFAAFGNMLVGELPLKHLSGPVSIASAAGESSSLGILPFLSFLAMVSVSLGILNLLPIPVLDGGHLLYYFAEILMGRPVSEAWMIRGQKIGILLIGLLTCVAFFNDIQRLL